MVPTFSARNVVLYIEQEGIINSKLEIRNSKLSKGYTLVEIVVVMAIIAVLMLLSGGVFINVRNQYLVDSAAEEVLTTIRDVQNRAISIQSSSNENEDEAKVWGVCFNSIDGGGYKMFYYTEPGSYSQDEEGSNVTVTNGIRLTSYLGTRLANTCVAYSAPFAKTYIHYAPTQNYGNWSESTTTTKDLKPTSYLLEDPIIRIVLSKNNYTNTVIINSKGDAKIE